MEKKRIFITNGSGTCGKDSFAKAVSEYVPLRKISSIDRIKEIARCGEYPDTKTEKDRKFLSDLKNLWTEYNDLPFRDISNFVYDFQHGKIDGEVLFIDIREPNEIERAKKAFCAKTILIKRDSVPIITSNEADANVNNYAYDYYIYNNGSLDDLKEQAKRFVQNVIYGEQTGSRCLKTEIDNTCIDCNAIGINETGKYCVNTITEADYEAEYKIQGE